MVKTALRLRHVTALTYPKFGIHTPDVSPCYAPLQWRGKNVLTFSRASNDLRHIFSIFLKEAQTFLQLPKGMVV